jgi:hypothetical protein
VRLSSRTRAQSQAERRFTPCSAQCRRPTRNRSACAVRRQALAASSKNHASPGAWQAGRCYARGFSRRVRSPESSPDTQTDRRVSSTREPSTRPYDDARAAKTVRRGKVRFGGSRREFSVGGRSWQLCAAVRTAKIVTPRFGALTSVPLQCGQRLQSPRRLFVGVRQSPFLPCGFDDSERLRVWCSDPVVFDVDPSGVAARTAREPRVVG